MDWLSSSCTESTCYHNRILGAAIKKNKKPETATLTEARQAKINIEVFVVAILEVGVDRKTWKGERKAQHVPNLRGASLAMLKNLKCCLKVLKKNRNPYGGEKNRVNRKKNPPHRTLHPSFCTGANNLEDLGTEKALVLHNT